MRDVGGGYKGGEAAYVKPPANVDEAIDKWRAFMERLREQRDREGSDMEVGPMVQLMMAAEIVGDLECVRQAESRRLDLHPQTLRGPLRKRKRKVSHKPKVPPSPSVADPGPLDAAPTVEP